ncbi:MAG TPA: O-antigen ligase family protein [Bryobacteraceae bacterium]|nr:O-antigen ligase family protein [Bryobacteraceae bacterium]
MSKFKPSRGSLRSPGASDVLPARKPPRSPATQWSTATTAIVGGGEELPSGLAGTSFAEIDDSPNPARDFALRCSLLFLYFRFSFVHEFASAMLHVDTHILIILGVLSYVAWFVAGNMFAAFKDKLAWIWTFFVLWLVLATVTSTWKGGSLALVMPYVRTVYPLMLLIPAVVTRPSDLKRVLNTLAFAGSTTILFGLVHRDFSQGRMDVGSDGSSINDPNDFAAHIIIMLPVIAYYAFAKGRSPFIKAFGAFIILAGLLEIMSTGSRGGFVALLAMLLYVALTGSNRVRLTILVGCPLAGLIALPLVPQQSRDRLYSIFDSSEASESAHESALARKALFWASIDVTMQHPIFGVGPGTFQDYQAGMAAETHQKGMWHETHNGYTQLSSECGIPAFLLYVTAVGIAFKSLRRAGRSSLPVVPEAAKTLAIMIAGFSVSLIFLAQGYRFTMLVVGAITVAINQMVKRYQELPR